MVLENHTSSWIFFFFKYNRVPHMSCFFDLSLFSTGSIGFFNSKARSTLEESAPTGSGEEVNEPRADK